MSSMVHTSSSPTFNTIRNSSMECIEKVKESFASTNPLLINLLPALTTQHHHLLIPIFSKVQNFIKLLKKILPEAFTTIGYPSFLTKDQHPEEAEILLQVLKSLVGSVRRFTDESLESIGLKASETLIEITRQMQELEKELDEAKVSVRFYNANFSALVMAFAALLAPVATLAVAPCLQRLDLVWEDFMEKPIVDKLKVLQAILFSIHSTITVAGKIQDSVHRLSNPLNDLFDPAVKQSYEDELKCMRLVVKSMNEDFKIPKAKGIIVEGGLYPLDNPFNDLFDPAKTQRYEDEFKFMCWPVKMMNEEDFKIKKKKKKKKGMEEGEPSNSEPFSEVRYVVNKSLLEMEKLVADTTAEVEMAEHELEQLIQTLALMPPLREE